MKVAIGCDEAAYELKEIIKAHVAGKGHEVIDFGVYQGQTALYPDIGYAVAKSILAGENERGILLCGTGIGMAIVANKLPGIRAAVCHDVYSAERARKSNDAQIMTMGARVIGSELAKCMVNTWLEADFETRSKEKLERISEYELEEFKRREYHAKDNQ